MGLPNLDIRSKIAWWQDCPSVEFVVDKAKTNDEEEISPP